MVPLLAIVGIGVAVGLGWRAIGRQHARTVEQLKRARSDLDRRAPVTLEKDPKTGVYRPRGRE
jgi:hypothetical protein